MTVVLNDPSLWPAINAARVGSYLGVVACAVLIYDWVLTFEKEVELVWRQRWSLMTFLYLSVRYLGIFYAAISLLSSVPTISVTDAGCLILYLFTDWMTAVVFVRLPVIMLARLYAMYQRSRKVLILLGVVLLAVSIGYGVLAGIKTRHSSGEELILSGTYQCIIDSDGQIVHIDTIVVILATVREVLTLCLAVRIAVKHFRELRRSSAGGIIGDCFTVLMKTHVVYFASFVALSCFGLTFLSSTSMDPYSMTGQIYIGFLQITSVVQMFVLGSRLILGVREYHAKLVANSDTATAMTPIAFQERVHVPTSNSV